MKRYPGSGLVGAIYGLVLGGLLLGAAGGRAQDTPYPAPPVQFVVATAADREAAEICAEAWTRRGPVLVAELWPAGTVADTVRCLLMDSPTFSRTFANRLPDWGVGVALPDGRVIALDHGRIPAVGRGLAEVFLHEMVHALLFQGAQRHPLPAWLHEGTAMLYSGEWRFSDTVSLVLAGRVPELGRLRGRFPAPAVLADRAYRTSLLAVNRLRDRYGVEVIRHLLQETARTGDFDTAFLTVTGQSLEEFSNDFDAAMRLRFGWVTLLVSWPGLFVVLTLVFAIGGGRKLILTRRRLAEMADEEAGA